jgi:hypothetical protein
METQWINLLLQIPLAGIVVFLTIRFLKHLENVNKTMLEFIEKQEETNREFLQAQRQQMNEAIGRLAEEIKANKYDTIKEISALVNVVDKLLEKIDKIVERLVAGVTKKGL